MWRSLCGRASSKKLSTSAKLFRDPHSSSRTALMEAQTCNHFSHRDAIFFRLNDSVHWNGDSGAARCAKSKFLFDSFGFFRGYASVAEAIVSTEEEDSDEIKELVEEMHKEVKAQPACREAKYLRLVNGIRQGKYFALQRRQIKMETESWEIAAKEYQELLEDMCEHNLAPNLPYMKSLFLGWFEPLRNAIAAEQDLCKNGKHKGANATHFALLPADMMAVITMHKLVGLLMTGQGQGGARVIQAACQIGEAVEHEFLHLR